MTRAVEIDSKNVSATLRKMENNVVEKNNRKVYEISASFHVNLPRDYILAVLYSMYLKLSIRSHVVSLDCDKTNISDFSLFEHDTFIMNSVKF